MPLKILKAVKEPREGDPNAILQYRVELLRLCYSSVDANKQGIVDEMNARYSDCSKKSIERVLKEVIVKEKRGQDVRPVYYVATQEILDEICDQLVQQELVILAERRMAPLIQEIQEEEARRQQERDERERVRLQEKAVNEALERERLAEKERARQEKESERLAKEAQKEIERKTKQDQK